MARVRSPNYPAISLGEAITRISQIHEKDGQNAVPKDVLVKHMGYGSLSGASMPVLSALTKYGLLDEAEDGEWQVSGLAIAILYPHSENEKAEAIRKAANKPALFAEINEKWPQQPPSDEGLRAYLVRDGFSHKALDNVIRCYRETMELVSPHQTRYPDVSKEAFRGSPQMKTAEPIRPQPGIGSPGHPLRVSMTDDRLEVMAGLEDQEGVERLIRILQANKPLLPHKKPGERLGSQEKRSEPDDTGSNSGQN